VDWFTLTFTPFMLLAPIAIVLLTPKQKSPAPDAALVRRRLARLLVATATALAIFAALYLFVAEVAARFAWVMFFPLWFGLAVPLYAARRPRDAQPPHEASGRVRTAALTNRLRENPVPASAWWVLWAIWVAGVAALAIRLAQPFEGRAWLTYLIVAPILLVLGPFDILIGRVAVRMTLQEPEPLDAGGSAELAEAYATHRRRRVWFFYWLAATLLVTTICSTMAFAWVTPGPAFGYVGGAIGTILGTAGGFVGLWFTMERSRLSERLEQLASAET